MSTRSFVLSIALCAAFNAQARAIAPDRPPGRAFFPMESLAAFQNGMSLEQAVAMAQSKYGARVMRANTVEEGGRIVHYIRLMSTDRSRVWTVRIDAATGREF